MAAEARFRLMGTDALVRCVGIDDAHERALVERARARLEDLEQRWSRFLAGSEVSQVNASAGVPVSVTSVTLDVVIDALEAWRLTAGRFDPTLLVDLERAGYDRSFDQMDQLDQADHARPAPPIACHPSVGAARGPRGAAAVQVDAVAGTVVVAPGVGLDLGGIGKGRAADLVVEDLRHAGALGACVDLGGDIRVAGRAGPPSAPEADEAWIIGLDDPADSSDRPMAAVGLADGAVATSTRCRRRWRLDGRAQHHLIDPSTGRPCAREVDTVTVVAAQAWWAEVLAKAALVAGLDAGVELLEAAGVAGLLRTDDGRVHTAGGFERFEVSIHDDAGAVHGRRR